PVLRRGALQPPGRGEQVVPDGLEQRGRNSRALTAPPGWDQHRYLVIWNDLNDVETLHVITVARKLVPSEEPFRARVHAPRRLGQGEDEVSGEKVVTALAVDRVRVDQHVGEGGCRVSDIRA